MVPPLVIEGRIRDYIYKHTSAWLHLWLSGLVYLGQEDMFYAKANLTIRWCIIPSPLMPQRERCGVSGRRFFYRSHVSTRGFTGRQGGIVCQEDNEQ